jgi:hypothetical protein
MTKLPQAGNSSERGRCPRTRLLMVAGDSPLPSVFPLMTSPAFFTTGRASMRIGLIQKLPEPVALLLIKDCHDRVVGLGANSPQFRIVFLPADVDLASRFFKYRVELRCLFPAQLKTFGEPVRRSLHLRRRQRHGALLDSHLPEVMARKKHPASSNAIITASARVRFIICQYLPARASAQVHRLSAS